MEFLDLFRIVLRLRAGDVVRSLSFLFYFHIKLYFITLQENFAKTGILDVTLMEENILPVLGCDKSESFCCIKKLNRPLIHTDPFIRFETKNPSQLLSGRG
jgi:hypothetical protein